MSIQPWYDVWCDAPDCLQWASGGATRADAAKSAIRAGWQQKRAPERWYCPEHREPKVKP